MDEKELTKRLIDCAAKIFFESQKEYAGKGMTFFESKDVHKTDFIHHITAKLKDKFPVEDNEDLISISTLKRYHKGSDVMSAQKKSILCAYQDVTWEEFITREIAPHAERTNNHEEKPADEKQEDPIPEQHEHSSSEGFKQKTDRPDIKRAPSSTWQIAAVIGALALAVSAFYIREISSFLGEISSMIKQGPDNKPTLVEMQPEKSWLVDDKHEDEENVIRLKPADQKQSRPTYDYVVELPKQAEESRGTERTGLPPVTNKEKSTQQVFYNTAEKVQLAICALQDDVVNNSLASAIKRWSQQQQVLASLSFLTQDFYQKSYFDRAFNGDISFLADSKVNDYAEYLYLLKATRSFTPSRVQAELTVGKANYEIVIIDCNNVTITDSYSFQHTVPGISEESIGHELQNLFIEELKSHPLPLK
jgi:hypothetical protein